MTFCAPQGQASTAFLPMRALHPAAVPVGSELVPIYPIAVGRKGSASQPGR